MKTNIQLSDHFTYRRLLRFVIPSIIMMIFSSIYSVVDGLFISNFVGKTPFAAVNLIMPFIMVLGSFGFMFGTGGNRDFFYGAYFCLAGGGGRNAALLRDLWQDTAVGTACLYAAKSIPELFHYGRKAGDGVKGHHHRRRYQYGVGCPSDRGLPFGVAGAAAATAISQCVGGLVPVVYFIRKNSSLLRLTKTSFMGKALLQSSSNGMSELVSNISRSVVSMLYNFQLMRIAGESGVAAYGVIMYVNFIFAAIFLGYSIGTAPIFSFHYGAGNHAELQNVFQKSIKLNLAAGVILTAAAMLLAAPLSKIFVGYDAELYAMTTRGFRLYSISFLLCGFSIFGSAFFTALNDGVVSAFISFLRTVVFEIISILVLPYFLGLDGVWYSISVAEGAALIVTVYFFLTKRKKYHYA